MKIIFQSIWVYFTVAVFAAECCINPKILPISLGDGPGIRPVEGILVRSQKHSYLGAGSRSLNSASITLFLEKLSKTELVKLHTYHYIQSQETPREKLTLRLKNIGYYLVFICLVIL